MRKLALALTLVSAPALACDQAGLAGRWNLMFDDKSCEMTVEADGRVKKGSCSHMADDPEGTIVKNPVRGRLKVLSACRVSGSLKTENREGTELRMLVGPSRLGVGLEHWHGLVWVGRKNSNSIEGFGPSDEYTGDYTRFSAVYIGDS